MNKKLIFLRKGLRGCFVNTINIDTYIHSFGFLDTVKLIKETQYKWYTTTCPAILNIADEQGNPIWWNEDEHKWDIYFIPHDGKDEFIPIQKYTDKELRKAHNIEKMYLNGGFDDKEGT